MKIVSNDKMIRDAVSDAVRLGCQLIITGNSKAKLKSPSGRVVMLIPNSPKHRGFAHAGWIHQIKKLAEK